MISDKNFSTKLELNEDILKNNIDFLKNKIGRKTEIIAVLKAKLKDICPERINVSKAIEVKMPFKIANDMMAKTGQAISIN